MSTKLEKQLISARTQYFDTIKAIEAEELTQRELNFIILWAELKWFRQMGEELERWVEQHNIHTLRNWSQELEPRMPPKNKS